MPLLDGIQAAEQIRASTGATTRIVVLSAYDDATFQHSAKTAGADRFLVKGCPLADVVRALTSAT
jgi:DNA-binding NarL/FixJ family response regulator